MRPITYWLICLCTLANFINSADRAILPIAIIQMAKEYSWNLSTQGWILSSFSVGYILSQIVGTSLASKIGVGNVLTISVGVWSFSMFVTPLVASNLTMLFIFRILLGLGEGLGLPMIFQLFAANVPVSERSRAFGYLISAGTIGQTLAAILTPHVYWPWMFYKFGFLGIVWTWFWIRFYYRNSLEEGTKLSKTSLLEAGLGGNESEKPLIINATISTPATSSTSRLRKRDQWMRFFRYWPLWAIYIAHFAMNWSNYIIMQWFPYYMSRHLGADQSSLSLTALPYVMSSIAGIVAGHLADNLITERKWSILSVRRLMTGLALFGTGVCMLFFISIRSILIAVIVICAAMSFCAFNSAGHLSNHSDIAPNYAGITFAISNTIATIPGILCGPLTAELVTQSSGRWLPVFAIAAGINFVGSVIYVGQSSVTQIL